MIWRFLFHIYSLLPEKLFRLFFCQLLFLFEQQNVGTLSVSKHFDNLIVLLIFIENEKLEKSQQTTAKA